MRVRCGFSGFSADWVAQRQLSEPGPPGLASGKAPKSRECAKAALKLSPVQGPFCSGFESKSKAPKTPPSHGLTGFAAIKPVAKPAMFFGPDQRQNPPCRRTSRRFGARSMQAGHALAAFGNQSVQTWRRNQKPEKSAQTPQTRESGNKAQRSPSSVLLQFQEQIKGPKNASIARFDRLGCYQIRSEIPDLSAWLACRQRRSALAVQAAQQGAQGVFFGVAALGGYLGEQRRHAQALQLAG